MYILQRRGVRLVDAPTVNRVISVQGFRRNVERHATRIRSTCIARHMTYPVLPRVVSGSSVLVVVKCIYNVKGVLIGMDPYSNRPFL